MPKKNPDSQSGFALLIVLAVIALLGVVIIGLNTRVVSHTIALKKYASSQKAYALATAGVEIAKVALKLDGWENQSDSFFDRWAELPKVIEGDDFEGTIEVTIEDESSKLNPNAFLGKAEAGGKTEETRPQGQETMGSLSQGQNARLDELQEILERLFEGLGMDAELVQSLMDWLDKDDEPRTNGAESDYYADLRPPYAPTNGPLGTLLELRLIKGFTHENFKKLQPYLSVYSEGRVNVNTADKRVLECLSSKISPFVAEDILGARAKNPIESKEQLQRIPGLSDEFAGGVLNYFDVKSDTFRVLSTGKVGSLQETLECILRREEDGFRILRWVWL